MQRKIFLARKWKQTMSNFYETHTTWRKMRRCASKTEFRRAEVLEDCLQKHKNGH